MFTNDVEWCIAATLDDAMAVMEEFNYEPDREAWGPLEDTETIAIWCDADGDPTEPDEDGAELITKTAAEWALRGRGFLCTTEW